MSTTQHAFAAQAYAPRAQDYVTSAVHAAGPDLDAIEDAVRGRATAQVLDLGCGGGHVTYRAAPHVAQVTACDVTQAMLDAVAASAAARGLRNVATRQGPAEALPFADGIFDMVLCRLTAHHWADMPAGLRQARRVLRPGGSAMFIDTVAPADPALDSALQAIEVLRDPSHVRNYTIAEWVTALSAAGFALQGFATHAIRLGFADWIARTRTPPLHAEAIRSLLEAAPAALRAWLAVAEDGSFQLEAATFQVRAV